MKSKTNLSMSSAVKVPSVFDAIFYLPFSIKNFSVALRVALAIAADFLISSLMG